MNKEEFLKAIMKLPKIETVNPICTMNSINVDDLMSAFDRLNKVPDYNDLLKENQELKKKYENAVADYETTMFEKEQLKKQLEEYKKLGFKHLQDKNNNLETQQKEFIKYLEDLIKQNETVVEVSKYGLPKNCSKLLIDFYKEILQKYKSITGVSDEKK